MVININPNRISGQAGSRVDQRRREQSDTDNSYVVPKRAEVNHIPTPESLRTLISSAVAALRKGIRWDRGTILNIVV